MDNIALATSAAAAAAAVAVAVAVQSFQEGTICVTITHDNVTH